MRNRLKACEFPTISNRIEMFLTYVIEQEIHAQTSQKCLSSNDIITTKKYQSSTCVVEPKKTGGIIGKSNLPHPGI